MDVMVLKTQEWLNNTYGGDPRFKKVAEDGNTGWSTIYALTRALQIELGITSTADNFGPTTISKFNVRYPNGVVQQKDGSEEESNVYAIIQGALWCKGYGTGSGEITKHFYGGTGKAVIRLKTDAYGVTLGKPINSIVTLNVMIALLSMNQYVLLPLLGGQESIREIQQNLNRSYEAYVGLMPCDGLYGREMNKALIKVLQAIEGLSPAEATGSFGETTKKRCPIFPPGGNAEAISLFRNALTCNGYFIGNGTTWDLLLETTVRTFQENMCIPKTGKADLNTWMSLLLSSGNPDRSATVCDTRFEITEARADQLISMGYTTVGRYLTGGDFKELRPDEPQRILNKGLKFFPIFQESGTNLSYFTYDRGKEDAIKASNAAKVFGIPEETVIYFAVDTDVLDGDISRYIKPYFEGVWRNIDSMYQVGIYGTRNVSNQIIQAGYAETCFVSDMSTGFSGNMGFKIPENWNYDQFAEIPLNPDWGIDKVGYSGKYPAVSRLNILPEILGFVTDIHKLEVLYKEYYEELFFAAPNTIPILTSEKLALGVTNFLRSQKYNGTMWNLTTGRVIEEGFLTYVEKYDSALYSKLMRYMKSDSLYILDTIGVGKVDIAHLAATTECYIDCMVPTTWTGWAGDLATGMGDAMRGFNKNANRTEEEWAKIIIGSESSSCNYIDLCCDSDAIKLADLVKKSNSLDNPLSSAIEQYYTNYSFNRYANYLVDMEGVTSLDKIKEKVYEIMNRGFIIDTKFTTVIHQLCDEEISDKMNHACCDVFAEYFYTRMK